jgi:hypothetical protein
MSDALRKVYEQEGQLANFFEKTVPTDLFRRRNVGDKTPIMQPTIIGFGKDDRPRPPDIMLRDERGDTPQYNAGGMVRESNSKPVTKQLISDASKYVVQGCRTTKGDFRGVSTFDMMNPRAKGVEWFYIPEGTEIPPGLAITRDGRKTPGQSLHHTIAPKDNMPFPLFLQHLKGFEAALKKMQG